MATVQQIILQLRSLGLSQTTIAKEIGAPQPRISRWERGEAPDAVEDALRLSDLLDRTLASKAQEVT